MTRLKKKIYLTFLTLLLGSMPVLTYNQAEAATYRSAVQDIMSRPYPRVAGNQFNDKYITSSTIQRIAKDLDIVAINKSSDLFVDKGANVELAKQIHSANPNVKVLQYLNIMDVWDYQTATYPWLKNNSAFLYDDAGKVIHPYSNSHRWAANSTKTSWQDYYANHAKKIVDQGMDGIFSDNWYRTNAAKWNVSSTKFAQIKQGWEAIGKKTKSLIGSNKILLGNSPADGTYQSRDISMIEMRNAPNSSDFKYYLELSDSAANYGQANFDTIQWGFDNSTFMKSYDSILSFSLPACLLTDNIFGISNDSKVFDLLEKVGKIGYAKGSRYRSNGILQRDFDKAKVLFNDTSSSVTISYPSGTYKDVNNNSVTKVTVAPFRGIILKKNETTSTSAPAAPSNLAVSKVVKSSTSGNYFVYLNWKDNSSNETGFEIYQSVNSTDPASFKLIKSPLANVQSYNVNIGANPAKGTYYYKILAVNGSGKSAMSNTAQTSIGTVTGLAAPSDLAVSKVLKSSTSGNYFVYLNWKDNSDNETGFELYQSVNSTDPASFKLIKSPLANVQSYNVNIGASPAKGTYYHKILAVNGSDKSAMSNTAQTSIQY